MTDNTLEQNNPFYRVPIAIDLLNYKEEDLLAPPELGEVKTQYYIKGCADYSKFKNRKDWLNQHYNADAILSTEDGTPLAAIYKSPMGKHEDMVKGVFKVLRTQHYNDWEYDD